MHHYERPDTEVAGLTVYLVEGPDCVSVTIPTYSSNQLF